MNSHVFAILFFSSCALVVSGQEVSTARPEVKGEDVPVIIEKYVTEPPKEPSAETVVLKETPVEKSPEDGKKESGKLQNEEASPEAPRPEDPNKMVNPDMLVIVPHDPHVYNPNALSNLRYQNYPYHQTWNAQPSYTIRHLYKSPVKAKLRAPVRFDPLGDFSDSQKLRQFYQDMLLTQMVEFEHKMEPLLENEKNMTEKNDIEDFLGHVSELKMHIANHQLFNISQIMEDWKQGKMKESIPKDDPQTMEEPSELNAALLDKDRPQDGQEQKPKEQSKPGEAIRTVYLMAPNPYQSMNRYPDNSHFHRQFAYNRPVIPIFRQQSQPNGLGYNNIQTDQAQAGRNGGGELHYDNAGRRYEIKPNQFYQQ